MKKSQSVLEYIIVIILFLAIIIYLFNAYFDKIPSEIGKIKEQTSCSKAEILASSIFNYPGEDSNWESSGSLTKFGLATSNFSDHISYAKWNASMHRGYYNLTQDTKLNDSFYISYFVYGLPAAEDDIPSSLPNAGAIPSVYIIRRNSESLLKIYGGSSDTLGNLDVAFFFPQESSVTFDSCSEAGSDLEGSDSSTSSSRDGGVEARLQWNFAGGDLDCINITLSSYPTMVYIKDMKLDNSSLGQIYNITLSTTTLLKDGFGSSGYVDATKQYCEVVRNIILEDNNQQNLSATFNLIAW